MKISHLIDNAIESLQDGVDTISDKYNAHVREQAIEKVNEKIAENGIEIEQIKDEDYEAMVSDLSKDIKEDYAKKASQGLLMILGIDFLIG
jgi:TRAP-type C4-dicarboxylate transport system substrate-binding protein